ncbi:MAG TPA: peptidyl-prolyl cis-trans isomerase [Solirubrobacterales bacterium]|nr:peptidyl-prolyl cis-trans isomerase [Solirubrobacterales bacterium]
MSPDRGRKGTSGKGGAGKASDPAAARRLGLLVFGLAFVVLFAWVAIADGVGDPSIPSGNVALVENTPGDIGEVTKERLDHALLLAAVQGGEKAAPKPGDPKYDELKESALNSIFESIWLQGIAAEWGIEASEQEVAAELKKVKKESFKTEAEFKKFLKESHYTPADVNERVKIQILSKALQEQLKEKVPTPSQDEVKAYYEAAKDTQFTQKASRDVRTIVNKDRKKAEEAKEALSKDDSAKNWKKVAKEFSEDPTTKNSGGLQKGLQEGTGEEPLTATFFSTPEGQVEGPVKSKNGYTVFEVENSTPESVQALETVESQIQSTLAQRAEQEYLTNFVSEFNTQWTQRTFCASGYVTERCANFKDSGHPATAPAGCYEANPKGGLPEACPAPVFQLIPALPGTVTPLEPTGKPLAQRPKPKEEAGKAAAGATGLPEGAVPPTGEEAPPEEAPSE